MSTLEIESFRLASYFLSVVGKMADKKEQNTQTEDKLKERMTKDLEKQDFFHGFRPRKDIVKLLREPGDFLVRVTDSRLQRAEIVISVLDEKSAMLNLTLAHDNNAWQIAILKEKRKKPPTFPSVTDLITFYMKNKLASSIKLRRIVPRPTWLINPDQITFDKEKDLLGRGNFCNVYRGVYQRTPDTKITVAAKICHGGKETDKDFEDSREARNQMIAEAQLMSFYIHDYIIQLHGVACVRPPIMIVIEYCPGGDLATHLKKAGEDISTGERLMYAMEAARGMRFLHSSGCIHRDLAARNCLISEKGWVKIADFGLSKLVAEMDNKDTDEEPEASPQVPVRWMAPESLKKPMKFSKKSDVWSFGVLLYEIFNNGVKPWPDEPQNKRIATWIRKGQMMDMPAKTPAEVTALCKKIWTVDESQRPEMKHLCRTLHEARTATPAPPEDKWIVNTIPGVARVNPATEETNDSEEGGKNSLDGPQTQLPPSTTPSKDDDKSVIVRKKTPASAAPRRPSSSTTGKK